MIKFIEKKFINQRIIESRIKLIPAPSKFIRKLIKPKMKKVGMDLNKESSKRGKRDKKNKKGVKKKNKNGVGLEPIRNRAKGGKNIKKILPPIDTRRNQNKKVLPNKREREKSVPINTKSRNFLVVRTRNQSLGKRKTSTTTKYFSNLKRMDNFNQNENNIVTKINL